MIFTLIIGFAVGAFYQSAVPFMKDGFGKIGITLPKEQIPIIAIVLCLGAALIVLNLIGVHDYPLLLCIGAIAGIARKELLARITGKQGK
ncbi:hypothetical protein [Planktotalea sp.]|uniref:hypothetical protein n=1 Tax=Planktotalea sp. TaxID=2029877 RepID=UPI003D6BA012